jgi:DNA-binding NtrC family response regulator
MKSDGFPVNVIHQNKSDTVSVASRILIVDDDAEVSKAVAQMLEHLGYVPIACGHAEQALQLIRSQKIDLMLVDYRMPDLTGLDLISMVKEENHNIPIIMMTGYTATESRISSEKLDKLIVLKKPITVSVLEKAVKDSLKGE